MIEYCVVLKRHQGSSRPNVVVFSSNDRKEALMEMRKYVKQNGFTVRDHDGRFTVADVRLVAKEPIVGASVISDMAYCALFNIYDEPFPGVMDG